MKICNVYSYDLPSVGDRYCAPSLYFDFPVEVDKKTGVDPDYDFIIFGGGGHIHLPSPDYNDGKFGHLEAILPFAKKIIMWGVGHNVHGTTDIEYPDYMDDFLLTGYRDYQRKDWVPCPSCMHKVFDKKYKIEDEFRKFHKKNLSISGDHPSMQDDGDLIIEEVVSFLGGAETILTNSYHGAFWGLLLGRKVIIGDTYSSKFFGLLKTAEKTRGGGLSFESPVKYLEKCRKSNELFYKKVLEILS